MGRRPHSFSPTVVRDGRVVAGCSCGFVRVPTPVFRLDARHPDKARARIGIVAAATDAQEIFALIWHMPPTTGERGAGGSSRHTRKVGS